MSVLLETSALAGLTIDVKDFGAKGDCQRLMDGLMERGSFQLSSASATFSSTDTGKEIYIADAGGSVYKGKPVLYGNLPLDTTIAQVVNSYTVILQNQALNSVSGASVSWGADDTIAIQKAIESLAAFGGGTVFFPAGMYRVTSHVPGGFGIGFKVDISNIRLTGTGDTSKIFNSSLYSFMTQGTDYYHEVGVSVAYVGTSTPISNIEIDHLWFGDNGGRFNLIVEGPKGAITNPEGAGVLGTTGVVNNLNLHDLTVVTTELCGINTDAQQSSSVTINHVTVQSNGGNHGMYLAGYKSHLTLSNSVITSNTTPMRIGVAVKTGSHILIQGNTISNFAQQGIGLDANAAYQVLSDVIIRGNTIVDDPGGPPPSNLLLPGSKQTVNTHGIQLNNGIGVVIKNNTIKGTNYSGLYVGADLWPISHLSIQNNFISSTKNGIALTASPVAGSNPTPLLSGVSITGNIITKGGSVIESTRRCMGRIDRNSIVPQNRREVKPIERSRATTEDRTWLRKIFTTLIFLFSMSGCLAAVQLGLSGFWSESSSIAVRRRATKLGMCNPEPWMKLADLERDRGLSVSGELDSALACNPLDPDVMTQLALENEIDHHLARALDLLSRAAKVDRGFTPRWSLANFYLRRGNTAEFFGWIHQALSVGYRDFGPEFALCWQASDDPVLIYESLPRRPLVQNQYRAWLARAGKMNAAHQTKIAVP